MAFYIKKFSGEKELFNIAKFRHSLQKAGAPNQLIDQLVNEITTMPELRSTKDIYKFALQRLHELARPIASRYSIKRALFELGPIGYPFEHFIGEVFKELGYATKNGTIVPGWCVEHEIDVLAAKDQHHDIVECKFHNRQGLKTDVKVTLYVRARFEDIQKVWKKETKNYSLNAVWVVTNTKFTTQAIQYANCANMQLLGWSYPEKNNLQDLIERFQLHPITTLVSLSRQQKRKLINNGIVLCRELPKRKDLLRHLGIQPHELDLLMEECTQVCQTPCRHED